MNEGKWRASPVYTSGATISIQIGANSCDWAIGEFAKVLPNDRHDDEVIAAHIANGNLIVSAVNACKSVNEDCPEHVAEAIKPMFEALKACLDKDMCWEEIELLILDALALADRRE